MQTAAGKIRTALVTGASSGIGAACVRRLAAEGLEVWALARRADRLAALARETGCTPLVADIRDTDAMADVLGAIAPDVLINNAGLGAGITGLVEASPTDVERTIGTNVTGLLQTCQRILPGMIARGGGHVVNIGSTAGLRPIASAVYGGSKGAVHLISQNLRLELRGTGVRVTEICPGRVTTEFFDVAVPGDAGPRVVTAPPIRCLDAEDVADAVVHALRAPPHVNVSMIEINPIEQQFGGVFFDAVDYREA